MNGDSEKTFLIGLTRLFPPLKQGRLGGVKHVVTTPTPSYFSMGKGSKTGEFYFSKKGFTLIELLVVIAIIGVLASTVLAFLNSARAKARDARKRVDFRAISTALQLFFDANGRMPNNYAPGSGVCEGDSRYDQSMQEVVSAGFLSVIPRSPGGDGYCWYNYGGGGIRLVV